MASFIHQATVRRSVVIQLIVTAKARGHRAYRNVNLDQMRLKAQNLPEQGVPPEIIRVLPHDTHLDKIQVQKAATPESGRSTLEGVTAELERSQPNAVLLEATGEDEADINAQRISALRILSDKLVDDVVTPSRNQNGASGSGSSRVPIDARKPKVAKNKTL